MKLFRWLALLALLVPGALAAQEITVDTILVRAIGAQAHVTIRFTSSSHPSGWFLVGDTVDFELTAVDEFGDTIPVEGDIISLDTLVFRFFEQGSTSARGVWVNKGQAQITAINLILGSISATQIGWLDPDSLGAWVWPEARVPRVESAGQVQFCAAVYYDTGMTGVGNTPECLLAYNNMVASALARRYTQLAFARRTKVDLAFSG